MIFRLRNFDLQIKFFTYCFCLLFWYRFCRLRSTDFNAVEVPIRPTSWAEKQGRPASGYGFGRWRATDSADEQGQRTGSTRCTGELRAMDLDTGKLPSRPKS